MYRNVLFKKTTREGSTRVGIAPRYRIVRGATHNLEIFHIHRYRRTEDRVYRTKKVVKNIVVNFFKRHI